MTGDTGPLHLAVALKPPPSACSVTGNPRHTGPLSGQRTASGDARAG
ncbi:glycosyltransferase family 9 protein [Serratia ureilytica]